MESCHFEAENAAQTMENLRWQTGSRLVHGFVYKLIHSVCRLLEVCRGILRKITC